METLKRIAAGSLCLLLAAAGCDDEPATDTAGQPAAAVAEPDAAAPTGGPSMADQPEPADAAADRTAPATTTKVEPGESPAAKKLMDAATAARGGWEAMDGTAFITADWEGELENMKLTGRYAYLPGRSRLDLDAGAAYDSMVGGIDRCWKRKGPVVLPCQQREAAFQKAYHTLLLAAHLWPMRKTATWALTADSTEEDGRRWDVLHYRTTGSALTGELLLDPETHLVARGRCRVQLGDKRGRIVIHFSDYRPACGSRMAHRMRSTFAELPLSDERLSNVSCQRRPADDFIQPQQVADGTVQLRRLEARARVCTEVAGPLSGLEQAFPRIGRFMRSEGLRPLGPPELIYRLGPHQVDDPARQRTGLCFPLKSEAAAAVESRDGFTIERLEPAEAITIYTRGHYLERAPEVIPRLAQEANKRGLTTAGHPVQVTYMQPTAYPVDELVSAIYLRLEE
jgi:hypothetical protein